MAADVLVSRELKSLQDELSVSQKQRTTVSAAASAAPPTASSEPAKETADERDLREQLRQFASELTSLFDEAEKGISTHPTQSVVGALLIGILIGRLLARR
jgi:ElaB/YqjD/DUF883 family membrane-anchored ribosome-binding protein